MTATPTRPVDYSRRRRRHALAILKRRAGEERWAALSDNARVMYTVGLLVCSPLGFARKADMDAALADPSAVNAARQLLAKVGW